MKDTVKILICFIALASTINIPSHALTREEALEIISADRWKKPDRIFNAGDIVGWMRYCRTVDSKTVNQTKINMTRWIRLAATDYDETGKGKLNKNLFDSMIKVFNEGISRGRREGKIGATDKYGFNKFCGEVLGPNPKALDTVWLRPPKYGLGAE